MKLKTRRSFIEKSLLASAGSFWALNLLSCQNKDSASSSGQTKKPKKLKILILGGTSFLGPHQVKYALDRGHTVSTFTRGKTLPSVNQEYFDKVESLVGDREDNLTALENRQWDVVIDNSGRNEEWTKATANLLKDSCGLYLYTSSTGVYYPYLKNELLETDSLVTEVPEGLEGEMKMEYDYGVMKTNSEKAAMDAFGEDRTIVVRPTYMMGPADKTNRFIHWPIRLSRGGEVMVPGRTDDAVQYIDVRDVADFMIRLAEQKKTGKFNAAGPSQSQTIQDFVKSAAKAFDLSSTYVYIDDYKFLEDQGVYYLVPWIPLSGNNKYSANASIQKSVEAGLTFRPITESMKDIHDWWYSDNVDKEKREEYENNQKSVLFKEKEIIQAWQSMRN